MKKRHYLLSILAVILIGLLVVSCTVERRPGETAPQTSPDNRQTRFVPRISPDPNSPQNDPGMLNNPSPGTGPYTRDNRRNITSPLRDNRNRVGGGTNTTPMGSNMQNRAERIADAAAKQKEVQSAACIITGNTAMVGLQFNDQYKGRLTDSIKKQVEKKVKDADNRISRVVVTADPDLVSRIEEIFKEIGNGRPISGFTKELNEMINRINPK
ncbi:MAG: YhcN/YlaJ family sporulation lipoprotein [Caldicoprobacterales bacterium]|jgi:YhcN/YlaJ family sporulation lipoprotein|nr:YhcN/YlaJ family sporulation lipoprotein [Clostridiales bacterium]